MNILKVMGKDIGTWENWTDIDELYHQYHGVKLNEAGKKFLIEWKDEYTMLFIDFGKGIFKVEAYDSYDRIILVPDWAAFANI